MPAPVLPTRGAAPRRGRAGPRRARCVILPQLHRAARVAGRAARARAVDMATRTAFASFWLGAASLARERLGELVAGFPDEIATA
eukprot:11754781-Alexandrium_andersonii.AAC.1